MSKTNVKSDPKGEECDEEDKTLSNLTNKIRTLQLDEKWGLSKTPKTILTFSYFFL